MLNGHINFLQLDKIFDFVLFRYFYDIILQLTRVRVFIFIVKKNDSIEYLECIISHHRSFTYKNVWVFPT